MDIRNPNYLTTDLPGELVGVSHAAQRFILSLIFEVVFIFVANSKLLSLAFCSKCWLQWSCTENVGNVVDVKLRPRWTLWATLWPRRGKFVLLNRLQQINAVFINWRQNIQASNVRLVCESVFVALLKLLVLTYIQLIYYISKPQTRTELSKLN